MMQDKELPCFTQDDLLVVTDDRPIRQIGIIILVFMFGVLGTWGYLAPIDSSALAPGYVTVKSHRKTVQHLEGGNVSEILVKEGDIVKAGEVLLRLDGSEIKAQLEILKGQHITSSAQLARLSAERAQLAQIIFPDDLNDLSDPRIIEAQQGETQIFDARKSAYQGETSVLTQRVGQLSAKIKGLQGQVSSNQVLMKSYGEEVVDLKELLAEGFTNKLRLRDAERSFATNMGETASLNSEIAGDTIEIGETKLQILQLQKKFQEEVALKLGEVQAELYDVMQRLVATTDKVNRIDIIAPATGRVLGLSVHNIGGVISPGKPILDIVPQQEELIIDAQVSPMDIDRVKVGLLAEIRFSAFKQVLSPKMQGKVINLSADRLMDEKTGVPYYQAHIELTSDSYAKLGNMQLLPGMPAEVLINTGEHTVFEYLMQPITNAFARAFIED